MCNTLKAHLFKEYRSPECSQPSECGINLESETVKDLDHDEEDDLVMMMVETSQRQTSQEVPRSR